MTESMITLLQWLIPSGGIGAVIVWLTNKTLRNLRTAKEVHDTYKAMYEDVNSTLVDIRKENQNLYQITCIQREENEKLYKAIASLERALSRAASCRHWDSCPIRPELRKQEGGGANLALAKLRQHRNRSPSADCERDPGIEGADADIPSKPP